MKKVILEAQENIVREVTVSPHTPIFVKTGSGKLIGMVVKEKDKGWITKIGGGSGSHGYYGSRVECMLKGQEYGHYYFVEEK